VNEPGSARACANLGDPGLGSPAMLGPQPEALGSGFHEHRHDTCDRFWADRQHARPALGSSKARGFHRLCAVVPPVVVYGSMCQRRFDLDEHAMDVDTAETLAGVVRLTRQAAALAWAAADRARAGSSGQLFALGVDLAADQARHLVPDGTEIEGPVPVGDEPAGLLRSAELLLRRLAPLAASDAVDDLRATVPTWCGRRTPVSSGEGRTVAELLDDSDGLAREALLDMSADRALGMVRGWPRLMQAAAELRAVLPPGPTVSPNADPIVILAAMGRAVDRSVAAGHWPGRGPRNEAWEQIASNLAQARRLLQRQVRSEAPDGRIGLTTAKTQMLHALYVAAHATTVAITGYERGLQDRLEVGARRRQPLVE